MAKGKWEEQKQARVLRSEGKSVKEITEILGVSKSSVSRWVRNVSLTEEQRLALQERNPIYNNQLRGSGGMRKKGLAQRKQYQEEGAERAKKREPFFIAGCMLYWGEGSKGKNSISLSNTDENMIRFFVSFLLDSFALKDSDFKMRVNCYSGGPSLNEIEKYWKNITGLKNASISIGVDCDKRVGSGKKIKHPYGICNISVHKTDLVQQMFGAIQEIGGFKNEKWLG